MKDPGRLETLGARKAEIEAVIGRARPDVLGDVMVVTGDGSYIEAVYFSSEAEARRAEAVALPEDMATLMADFDAAVAIEEYLDLRNPWLH